ncbi:MAG: hypothetical protein A3E87_04370 [Gammaproteobacteria bacterium RIFCSPHIGHO2_12_FULL_35_23]|nr:MAG: hypothetical protein A3E87_04370 [Gammaproteobacteria bacterium RIFCSPHIGHO2_12_FULL_35_23]
MRQIILIGLSLFLIETSFASSVSLIIMTQTKPVTVIATMAKTSTAREKGLMNQSYLAPNQGMLFIFKQSQYLDFWMKNTLIPLDILFINDQWQIVNVQTMSPCTTAPCPIYVSAVPANYALEVNAGFTKHHQIQVGNKVVFAHTIGSSKIK